MNNESCQRCCGNCRFAMPVEHQGEPLLVCPYRRKSCGRLTAVEPQEGCSEFRARVRPKEGSEEGTCLIPLVNCDGLCALVDAADYEWLSRYTWRAVCADGGAFYACTYCEGKMCSMHRMIMKPPEGMVVDHKNRYGLDNHRLNLRNATPGQNCINRAWGTGVSGFRGVYPYRDRWQARIGHQYRIVYIGVFDDPAEAARAYDRKAIELHGEFACLNFPEEAGRRIVCLSGTARVCPAIVARIRRMLYGSSWGPSAPSPFAGVIPLGPSASRAWGSPTRKGPPPAIHRRWEPNHTDSEESVRVGLCGIGIPRSGRGQALPMLYGLEAHATSGSSARIKPNPYYALGTPCRCHAGRTGQRAPGIPVASRGVPRRARGPPWWARAEPPGQKDARRNRMDHFLAPAAP